MNITLPLQPGFGSRLIWDMILDNMKDMPAEEFAQLPQDGASELDHCLYGHPKRDDETGRLPR